MTMIIINKWKRTTAHLFEEQDDHNEDDYHSDDANDYDYIDDDDDF